MEYLIHLGILLCIYSILAQGLNIVLGLGVLFNLAHISLFGIGAYVTALLSTEASVGFFSCFLLSLLFSSFVSLALGLISLRLKDDYFAIGTLAFSSIVSALMINWKSLTRGVLGIPGIPRPVFGGNELFDNSQFLWLAFVIAVLVQIFDYLFFKSSFARTLRAQAVFQMAAEALGANSARAKIIAFAIASAQAGIAGCLFAYYINYIDPSSFNLTEMVFVLSIVVVGSPASFRGCLVGTFFLVLLPEPLRFLDIPSSILGPMRQLLYALILYIVVYNRRGYLFPIRREV